MIPGSQLGYIHNQRQGTGLATVLESNSDDVLIRLVELGVMQRGQKRIPNAKGPTTGDKKNLTDAYKRLQAYNPDYFAIKHQQTMAPLLEGIKTDGAKLIMSGEDPYLSQTPEAQAFRQQLNYVDGVARTSKEMAEWYYSTRKEIDGKAQEHWDPIIWDVIDTYVNSSPKEVYENQLEPPVLRAADPVRSLMDDAIATVSQLDKTQQFQNWDVPEYQRMEIARNMIYDGQYGSARRRAANQALAAMPKEEKEYYEERAKLEGEDVTVILQLEEVNRAISPRKPFDIETWVKNGIQRVDVPMRKYTGARSFNEQADKKQLETITATVADLMLGYDPRAQEVYYNNYIASKDPTIPNDRTVVQKHLAKTLYDAVAKDRSSGLTNLGAGEAIDKEQQDKWLSYMLSKDMRNMQIAADYIFGNPQLDNLTVTESSVDYRPGQVPYSGDPTWMIKMDAKPELLQAGSAVVNGQTITYDPLNPTVALRAMFAAEMPELAEGTDIQYKEENNRLVVVIPVNDVNKQRLLSFHDRTYRKTGQKFDPDRKLAPAPKQSSGAVQMSTIGAPKPNNTIKKFGGQ